MSDPSLYPRLQSCTKLATEHRVYDIKFYPYSIVDDDHIFAVVAETDAFVCRPKQNANPPYDILRFFRDVQLYDGEPASYNSVVWTKHPATQKPVICFAGSRPKQIKILDVEAGEIVRTLSGHGRGINDLAISPLSPSVLASCAEDGTIRIWNLAAEYEAQPCIALLGGAGHKQPILALHFHPNGRWLLSGGIDTAIALWAVPTPDELNDAYKEQKAETGDIPEPKMFWYPYFLSEEVHSNYVDCVQFYGDLIISRAARDPNAAANRQNPNEILIWKVDGFDPDDAPPPLPAIPDVGQRTRSAFPHDKRFRGFHRIATLNMPDTDRFYHRFSLFCQPGARPILVMGSQKSRYSFWDLQKLEEGMDAQDIAKTKRSRSKKGRNAISAEALARLHPEPTPSDATSEATPDTWSTPAVSERQSLLDDPFKLLEPNHTITANTKLSSSRHFASSQVAWSPDGTWLVGGGDFGMMCIFHRDKSAVARFRHDPVCS